MKISVFLLLILSCFSSLGLQLQGKWVNCTIKVFKVFNDEKENIRTETVNWCFISDNLLNATSNETALNVTSSSTILQQQNTTNHSPQNLSGLNSSQIFTNQSEISNGNFYQANRQMNQNIQEQYSRFSDVVQQNKEDLDQYSIQEEQLNQVKKEQQLQYKEQVPLINDIHQKFMKLGNYEAQGDQNIQQCKKCLNDTFWNYQRSKETLKYVESLKYEAQQFLSNAYAKEATANKTLRDAVEKVYQITNNDIGQAKEQAQSIIQKAKQKEIEATAQAQSIIQKAKQKEIEATAQAQSIIQKAKQKEIEATAQAQSIIQKAKQKEIEATAQAELTIQKAEQQAIQIIAQAKKEAQRIVEHAKKNETEKNDTNLSQELIPDETHFHYHYETFTHNHQINGYNGGNRQVQPSPRQITQNIIKQQYSIYKPESNFSFQHCKLGCDSKKIVYHTHYHWHYAQNYYVLQVSNGSYTLQTIQINNNSQILIRNLNEYAFSNDFNEKVSKSNKIFGEQRTQLFQLKNILNLQNESSLNITIPVYWINNTHQKLQLPLKFSSADFPGNNSNHYVKIYQLHNHNSSQYNLKFQHSEERQFLLQNKNYTRDSRNVVIHYHRHYHVCKNMHLFYFSLKQVNLDSFFANKSFIQTKVNYPIVNPGMEPDHVEQNNYYTEKDLNTSQHVENQNKHYHYSYQNRQSALEVTMQRVTPSRSNFSYTIQQESSNNTKENFDIINYEADMSTNQTHYHYDYTTSFNNIKIQNISSLNSSTSAFTLDKISAIYIPEQLVTTSDKILYSFITILLFLAFLFIYKQANGETSEIVSRNYYTSLNK